MAHIYDIGTRAWQPDVTEGWVASEVKDKQINGDKVKLLFQLENGEVCTCPHMHPLSRGVAADEALYRPKLSRRRCRPSRLAMTPTCLR